jgi:hypothetical protein
MSLQRAGFLLYFFSGDVEKEKNKRRSLKEK